MIRRNLLALAILALAAIALWQRKRLADAAWSIVWALRREDARVFRMPGVGWFLKPSPDKHRHWRGYFDSLAREEGNGYLH